MLFLLLVHATLGACPAIIDVSELNATIQLAEERWTRGDLPGFEASVGRVDDILPCTRRPLNDTQMASLHLLHGLVLWNPQNPEPSAAYLQAARSLGDGRPPEWLALSPESPLETAWSQAVEGSTEEIPPPVSGFLLVDGDPARAYTTGRPFVLQRTNRDGIVLQTNYVGAGESLPPYPRLRPRLAAVAIPFAVGSAVCLGGGLWTFLEVERARNAEGEWADREKEETTDALQTIQRWNHVALISASALGTVSLGTTAFWVTTWF